MYRRWRVRHSYPRQIVELVVRLEPIHGAVALSRLLDIPTSAIYRWRSSHRDHLAATHPANETATLAALVACCAEQGFHVSTLADAGDRPTDGRGGQHDAAHGSNLSPRPARRRAAGRYVFNARNERPLRRVLHRMLTARHVADTQYFLDVDCRMLAETARMSLHHFIRMFADMFGMPPHQYLMHTRVTAAKRLLLASNEPIEVIAIGVGFRSGASLNRAFRRIEGTSISKYCKTLKKGNIGRKQSDSIPIVAASAF